MVTARGNMSRAGNHVPELDGLRAIAILLVIVFHCRTVAQAGNGAEQFYLSMADAGWIGVDLFFVLSGYLITGILLDTVGTANYFRSFYIRRVLRIFPLYYAALAVYAVAAHGFGIERLAPPSIGAEVAHWFYVQNWLPLLDVPWTRPLAHFWSLGIEEQFYLFWPALVLMFARQGRAEQLCLGTIAFALAMRAIFSWAGESEAGNFATVTRLDTLAIGGYIACLLRRRERSGINQTVVKTAWVLSAAAALNVAIVGGSFFRPDNHLIFLLGLFPVAVFFGATLCLTVGAARGSSWIGLLRSKPMTALGKVSYGVYVVHWPLVLALQPLWPRAGGFWISQATFLAAITVASWAMAALSYYLFEQRFLMLKDRLAPR